MSKKSEKIQAGRDAAIAEGPEQAAAFELELEKKKLKGENEGLLPFAKIVDGWRSLEEIKPFGTVSDVRVYQENREAKRAGVTVLNTRINAEDRFFNADGEPLDEEIAKGVENPFGKITNLKYLVVSDEHARDPLRDREENLPGLNQALSWYSRLGYRAKGKELLKDMWRAPAIAMRTIIDFAKVKAGNESAQEKYDELYEKYPEYRDVTKRWWNVAAVIYNEFKRDSKGESEFDIKRIYEDIETVDERYTTKGWKKYGIWNLKEKIRDNSIDVIQEKFRNMINPDDNVGYASLGDECHDGGTADLQMDLRTKKLEFLKSVVTRGKKFFWKVMGNHEGDPREPIALREVLKLYGKGIYYQEVGEGELGENIENKTLKVSLNSFIMSAESYDVVLAKYLELTQTRVEDFTERDALEVGRIHKILKASQQEVLRKLLLSEKYKNVVVEVHNSRRFYGELDQLLKEGNENATIEKLRMTWNISGHAHGNDGEHIIGYNADGEPVKNSRQEAYVHIGKNEISLSAAQVVDIQGGDVKVTPITVDKDVVVEHPELRKFVKEGFTENLI